MDEQRQQTVAPLTIFYSYAHEDEALRDKLEDHLSSLQVQGLISEWYDRQIVAGTEWAYAIDSRLQTASIILLLISPAFMASDYCVSIEMQQAMERHRLGDARVIPIILRPAEWHDAPFAILQCLPRGAKPVTTWDDPEDAFEDITQGLRRAIEDMNLLFYSRGPRHPSAPMILAPSDGQWRKVSNRLRSPIDFRSRQWMLERVRTRWVTGLLKDSLNEAALITLGLHEQPAAVANPWSFSLQEMNQPARPLSLRTRVIQAYDYAQGELLILGEPGSGKTTLLLELTRDLIERAKRDETHPIPVIFNLSSWSLKQQPIAGWLVEELILKYQVPQKLAKHWVENEQVLPLLDGLDEVAPHNRADCIEALNRFKQDHGLLPMVITSRSADYLAQQSRVLLRTAIVIQPLTQEQIELYLASAKKQLAPVREALRADAELQELASTPLMLSILTLAYHGSSMNDLLALSSPLARREQIFATYVQRMFQRRGIKAHYSQVQTIRWLSHLASHMKRQSQSVFYVEQLQPAWLPGSWMPRIYSWLAIQLPDILIGTLVSLAIIILLNREISLEVILLGCLLGEIFSNKRIFLPSIKRGMDNEETFRNFPLQLPLMFIFFFIDPLLGICSLLLLLIFFVAQYDDSERTTQRVIRNGLLVGVLVGLTYGLRYGLGNALLAGVINGWHIGPSFGLSYGLNYGLSYGLAFGLSAGLLSLLLIGEHMTIQSTDRLIWTWRSLGSSFFSKSHLIATMRITILIALVIGLSVGLGNVLSPIYIQGFTLFSKLILALSLGLLGGLTAGLGYWFLFGLLQGISSATIDDQHRVSPNQGIRSSIRNGLLIGLISFMIVGLLGFLRVWLSYRLIPSLHFTGLTRSEVSSMLRDGLYEGLGVGLSIGLLVGFLNGGFASLRHAILRLLLYWNKAIPWSYPHFLDHAAERILLRKVGGGYIFLHRLLLDYFANLEAISLLQRSDRKPA